MPHHHWPPPILSQQQMDVWVEVPLQGWCKLANVRHDTTHKFQFTGKQPLKSQHFKIFRPSAKGKVMFGVSDRLWYRLGGLGAHRVTFRGYSMSATHSQPPSTLSSISETCGLRPKYANLLKTLGIWIKRAASFTQFDHNSDEFGARNIYLRPNSSAPVKLEPHQSRWREECKISP